MQPQLPYPVVDLRSETERQALRREWVSRRNLLKGLGLGAALFAPLMRELTLQAQGARVPKLLIFYTPNGCLMSKQTMGRSGQGANPDLPVFADSCAPLTPHAANIIVAKNVHGRNEMQQFGIGGHENAPSLLTGTHSFHRGDRLRQIARAPSFDRFLATRLGEEPLNLGILYGPSSWSILWRGQEQQVSAINDPRQLITTLYPNMPAPPPAMNTDGALEAARAKEKMCNLVRDTLLAESKILNARMGTEDKARLEPYIEGLDKLRCQAAAPAPMASPAPSLACQRPTLAATINWGNNKQWRDIALAQTGIIAEAFRCGVRRVATLTMGGTAGFGPHLLGSDHEHHGVSHWGPNQGGGYENPALTQRQDTAQAQLFGDILARLQMSGVLEDTIVMWVSEIADGGNHSHDNYNVILGGGGAGKIRKGRFLIAGGSPQERHLNRLLTAISHAMGQPIARFGDVERSTEGPMPGILV